MVNYEVLSENTKVWIYQSNKPFEATEVAKVRAKVKDFAASWVSHNQKLTAFGDVYHDRFIVLMVDEYGGGASGCSIDSSVKFIQGLEKEYGVDMFDRMNFTYQTEEGIKSAHKEEFIELYKMGLITDETLVFNNLISTKEDFENNWKVSLGNSWHKQLIAN